MRRYLTLLVPSFYLLVSCTTDTTADVASAENIVNVYNWSDYVAPDTIEKFEAETGIEVNYDLYDASLMVDVKMLTGNSGYDVVIHSNQYATRLTPIGVYEKLDISKLPNVRHIDREIFQRINVYENITAYSVPYHWGTTGYAYNVDMVRERLGNHPMDSADILFDPDIVSKLADCGVSLLDGPTDLFPMVLSYLGRPPNSVEPDDLAAAEAQLKSVRPYIRYFSNQKMMFDLPNKEVCVAMSWAGDYVQGTRRAAEAGIDIDLRYVVPKEGSGLWVDGVFMPADAPHKDNAYTFMNFLMRPDIAADIANHMWYANSNKGSREFIEPKMLADPAIYPDEEIWSRLYPILSIEPKKERPRTRAFARVKAGL